MYAHVFLVTRWRYAYYFADPKSQSSSSSSSSSIMVIRVRERLMCQICSRSYSSRVFCTHVEMGWSKRRLCGIECSIHLQDLAAKAFCHHQRFDISVAVMHIRLDNVSLGLLQQRLATRALTWQKWLLFVSCTLLPLGTPPKLGLIWGNISKNNSCIEIGSIYERGGRGTIGCKCEPGRELNTNKS